MKLMPRFTTAVALLGSVLLAGIACSIGSAQAADDKVTFHRDVEPILAKQCQSCHRPGQVAPMPFLTYKDTKPWAQKIKVLITDRKMPPVIGTPHYTVLTRGEGLTEAEIATLVKWVDQGAPEGKASDTKPAPKQTK